MRCLLGALLIATMFGCHQARVEPVAKEVEVVLDIGEPPKLDALVTSSTSSSGTTLTCNFRNLSAQTLSVTLIDFNFELHDPLEELPIKFELAPFATYKTSLRYPLEAALRTRGQLLPYVLAEAEQLELKVGSEMTNYYNPQFTYGGGSFRVSHKIPGRVMEFRLKEVISKRKKVAFEPSIIEIATDQEVPLPPLDGKPASWVEESLYLKYEFRLKPNTKWLVDDTWVSY